MWAGDKKQRIEVIEKNTELLFYKREPTIYFLFIYSRGEKGWGPLSLIKSFSHQYNQMGSKISRKILVERRVVWGFFSFVWGQNHG
jgi:hypothetical protein